MSERGFAEFFLFVTCFAILAIFTPPLLLPTSTPIGIFLLLESILLGVAMDLAQLLTAAVSPERDLPKLEHPAREPSVAVLFLVCDDVVPEALAALGHQTHSRTDFFVLDDSRDRRAQALVDAAPFRVVRRHDRKGNKAGNINHWLRLHGGRYDYFLILDSDSIVSGDFVEQMLRYAEHPANRDVAVFNSLPVCWNTASLFPRLAAVCTPIQNWMRLRLANRLPSMFSTGHNNLHRTEAVLAVGGFDERFVAEDIALTLRLIRGGYTSRLVNLTAGEAEPEHVFSHVRRLERWAAQTIEILRADWRSVPLVLRYQMFRQTWFYLMFFFYPLTAFLAAWGMRSTAPHPGTLSSSALAFAVLIASIPLIPALLKIPLALSLGISLADYARNRILWASIAWYAMLSVCAAQLVAAMDATFAFAVTDKRKRGIRLAAIVAHHWHLIPFWLFLAAGFYRNAAHPLSSIVWLTFGCMAPLLIYWFHGTTDEAGGVTL